MNEDNNDYNIANFIYDEGDNSQFILIENSVIKAYIISSSDLEKGTQYLAKLKTSSTPEVINISFYSSLKEIKEKSLNDNHFYLVNEDFLKSIKIEQNNYEGKNVFFFNYEEKQIILFPNECKKLEISKKEINQKEQFSDYKLSLYGSEIKKDEAKICAENDENILEKKNILRYLLLIYKEEKRFLNQINSPIKDEMKMEESYLINRNFVKIFKEKGNYEEICKIIESNNLNLENIENAVNDKSFLDVINKIKIFTAEEKAIKLKEGNIYPDYNQNKFGNLKDSNKLVCPNEFVLISKDLFDLFIKEIQRNQSDKKKYIFKTLIGDNILFIQDNNINNVFYAYKIKGEILEIHYLFKYNAEKIFYEEVKNYIKNKGFNNYILERHLSLNISQNLDLSNIGQYLCYKEISNNKYNYMKIENYIRQNENIYNIYKKFINNSFKGLSDKRIDLITLINDILDKKEKLNNILPVVIILKDNLDKLKQILLFKEIENLLSLNNNNDFNNKKQSIIINLLKNKNDITSDKENMIKNIKLFNPDKNDNDIKLNIYSFINKEILKLINNSIDLNNLVECFYFINNNEKIIFYPKQQKLYKLEFVDNDNIGFKLKEYELNLGFKEIKKYLLNFSKNENEINKEIKCNLNKITLPKQFYLVNKNWMKSFKNFYQYDKIVKNEIVNIFNNKQFPEELKNPNYLNCEVNQKELKNCYIPINFELVYTNLFDQLLNYINEKNKTKLQLKYFFNVSLGDKKIFVQDNNYNSNYFIYKYNNKDFELQYIINLGQFNNINDFISFSYKSHKSQNFEELMSFYYIDFSNKSKIQNIIGDNDNNLKIIGSFKIIKVEPNCYQRKEPVHCLGLENIGATCYMNATIQCLCHVLNVKNYFQNKQLVYNETHNKKCQLTLEFYKLVNNLWKESSNNKEYYTPKDFKDCISVMNPLFQGIAANDSKDLIIFIYETIHNEICKKIKYDNKTNNPDLDFFRENYYSENCSFLVDTFYFEQQSELICLRCNFIKISYNITNIIIFPLEKVREYMVNQNNSNALYSVTLENCFENYQDTELLDRENQIYCNNCNKMSDATTGNKMFTCPQVMTIILNRGKGLQFDVNFEYPLLLNIEKYVIDKKNGENYNYELICVLTHLGPSGMAGHFIAFCKSPVDNNWYCYNDAQVSKCIDPRSQSNNQIESIPYVLFYQKTNKNNQNNTITLFFSYKTKELYLDIEQNMKIIDLINILHNKKHLSKNIMLAIENKGEDKLTILDNNKTINDYNIKNESYITIVDK